MNTPEQLREQWRAAALRSIELREQLHANKAVERALLEQVTLQDWGVGPGSIVRCRGEEYLVTAMEHQKLSCIKSLAKADFPIPRRKPWLQGCPRNKDGSWSRRQRRLFNDWEVVEAEPKQEVD